MDSNKTITSENTLNPTIYIHQDGEQTGPYTVSDIVTHAKNRIFRPDAQFWRECDADWKPLGQLPEIKKSLKYLPEFMTQEEAEILKQIRGIGTYWIVFPTIGLVVSFFTLIVNSVGGSNNFKSASMAVVLAVFLLATFFASTVWAGMEIKGLKKWAWWYLVIYSCLFFWAGFNWIACPYTLYWLFKGRKMF